MALIAIFAGILTGCIGPPRADKRAIEGRYQQWHAALSAKQYVDAYALMSPDYRAVRSVQDFSEDFGFVGAERLRLHRDCTITGNRSEAWLYPFDDGWLELWNGPEFQLVKVNGEWFLSGERNFYVD